MIRLYKSWRESENVPDGWRAAEPPGAVRNVRVKNPEVLLALRQALPGYWVKVYRRGVDGSEVHYFKHESGAVALVKWKPKQKGGYEDFFQ